MTDSERKLQEDKKKIAELEKQKEFINKAFEIQ